jgi:IclR family mhp operon transcriptional activator
MAAEQRLLTVLRALNEIGTCTVLDLHRATGISRSAVYRVVDSLCDRSFVERTSDNRLRLTAEVRTLTAGYREHDSIVEAAVPVLERLQKEIQWPSSLATPDRDKIVVRETNRHRSPFVFDEASVGLRLPMLGTSLGVAYLAFCGRTARLIILDLLRQSSDRWEKLARDQKETDRFLRNTALRGYAFRHAGGLAPKTGSVAVPIMLGGEAIGSLCVTYAASAVNARQAASNFLPRLQEAVALIGSRLGN